MASKDLFLLSLFDLGIIKFGSFKLKSGIISPFYVDLRPIASYPVLLKRLAEELLKLSGEDFELICGVPYAAVPMSTVMSLTTHIPLIIKRKENKGYGTKKMVEGVFEKGQNCLLVEDVITSGKSLVETIEEINKEGLEVSDITVVLDRQQGGSKLLESKGYKVHALYTISEVVDTLLSHGKITEKERVDVLQFVAKNKVELESPKKITYNVLLEEEKHPKAKEILNIALEKKSNLICAADVATAQEVLDLADKIGPSICALKLHADVYPDYSDSFIKILKEKAKAHQFLLFEDRKFADIGNTQKLQFTKGVHKIAEWADLITTHVIGGEKSLDAFKDSNVGIVPILQMSSVGTLADKNYKTRAESLVLKNKQVIGGVAQSKLNESLLLFTPGVNMQIEGDALGQQYNTPDFVFENFHTDFIIVGRGIYQAENPSKKAKEYQEKAWNAYLKATN